MATEDPHNISFYDLFRLTLTPVVLLIVLSAAIYSCFYFYEHKSIAERYRDRLASIITENKPALKNEIYLSMEDAANVRIRQIIATFSSNYPDTSLCINIPDVPEYSFSGFASCENRKKIDAPSKIPVSIGSESTFHISYQVELQSGLASRIPYGLIWAVLLAVVISIPIQYFLINSLRRNIVSPLVSRIEEEAKNSALARMVHVLSHDIRSPLTTLRAGLKVLTSNAPKETENYATSLKQNVEAKIDAVNETLDDILELSRTSQPATKAVTLENIIISSLRTSAALTKYPATPIRYEIRHTKTPLVDRTKIQRALANLYNNAIEATQGQTTISLMAEDFGEEFFSLSITNTNSTIPKDTADRVFESFYTSGKSNGSGLGLAIVKKVVEAHGGQVSCRSESNSVTFTMTLPCTETGDEMIDYSSLQATDFNLSPVSNS